MVDIRELGVGHELVPYTEALALQRSTHASVVAGETGGTVLLLEHPSVYTAGKRTDASERPDDGTPVIDVDRGGKITWHGPGQLVGYPIVRLPEPVDVVQYVRDLESVLIAVLADLGVDARRVAGRSGAWVGEPGAEDKIAAIGIRVADGVAMHGFALNCSNSLDAYARIVACGIRDAGVTTISRVVGREVTPAEALPFVEERLAQLFERWVDVRAAAERLVRDRAAAAVAARAAVASAGVAA
ncbi:lipoate--protein ligase B [Subtercola boreus]|uniref:Octanoyltransferase n=1 Tax=Subtercola boreus TaxID=120213 RepID=A0A3E0VCS8_9MICO|nr:lipoyl(octanoyl) transferase LipB [Subtercola boreus]RFA07459.1 lipoate--protein ligase B [Subtercola boreus]